MNASPWQVLCVQVVVAAAALFGVSCELLRQAWRALDEARHLRAQPAAGDFDAAVDQALEVVAP